MQAYSGHTSVHDTGDIRCQTPVFLRTSTIVIHSDKRRSRSHSSAPLQSDTQYSGCNFLPTTPSPRAHSSGRRQTHYTRCCTHIYGLWRHTSCTALHTSKRRSARSTILTKKIYVYVFHDPNLTLYWRVLTRMRLRAYFLCIYFVILISLVVYAALKKYFTYISLTFHFQNSKKTNSSLEEPTSRHRLEVNSQRCNFVSRFFPRWVTLSLSPQQ